MHQLAKSCILEKKKNKITTFASNICNNNNNKNGKLVELYLDCIPDFYIYTLHAFAKRFTEFALKKSNPHEVLNNRK